MDVPGEFSDPFAAVYDARMADQDGMHTGDVWFYRDLAAAADGPALDIGDGTGRVYLDIPDPVLDVDGVDPCR